MDPGRQAAGAVEERTRSQRSCRLIAPSAGAGSGEGHWGRGAGGGGRRRGRGCLERRALAGRVPFPFLGCGLEGQLGGAQRPSLPPSALSAAPLLAAPSLPRPGTRQVQCRRRRERCGTNPYTGAGGRGRRRQQGWLRHRRRSTSDRSCPGKLPQAASAAACVVSTSALLWDSLYDVVRALRGLLKRGLRS